MIKEKFDTDKIMRHFVRFIKIFPLTPNQWTLFSVIPAIIGFVVTKKFTQYGKTELKPAATYGAVNGIVYAIVMIAVALFFIVVNYVISALLWGDLEIIGEGILVIIATILLGLPTMIIIGVISGGIGGATSAYLKK